MICILKPNIFREIRFCNLSRSSLFIQFDPFDANQFLNHLNIIIKE